MKKIILFFSVIIFIICSTVYSKEKTGIKNQKVMVMKIRLIFNGTILTATMYDNPTARDFIKLLPLTLKLDDYAGTEKISQLPKKLSIKDAPSGSDPSIGDITYYSPWGNLAIFYRDFSYASGLIKLGKIDSDVKLFEKWKESKSVKIELINIDNK